MLKDNNFLFWLEFFYTIIPHVDLIYDQIQSHSENSSFLQSAIIMFSKAISTIREKIKPPQTSTPEIKRRMYFTPQHTPELYSRDLTIMAKESFHTICFLASERFKFTRHLSEAKLKDSDQFENFSLNFPLKELEETAFSYPMLNKAKLRTEVSVLHGR
ncbi:hypothetical protein AVEN_138536-1 [Araneus ventricosus]|uniref:Uncharacterized protein n=1 Tax=Araneus ventricosus TaxID=182803 RepID=A0A4Y2GHC8_ARAVE|nr:hypothetical protein AVEN_138536-1 [Araneus ventricosus]